MRTRPISWVKAARRDFESFPDGAQEAMLRALTIVAEGGFPDVAKPMKGFGASVFELALKFRSDAYRLVYVVQLGPDVWVLHAFQKKSKTGIKTPKAETDLVLQRLKRLREALR